MKKKLVCLAAVLTLALSLAACGSSNNNSGSTTGADPYASLQKVQDNMKTLKDAAFSLNIKMQLPSSMGGSMTLSGNGKMIEPSSAKPELVMHTKASVVGQETKQTVYMKDGIVYISAAGIKQKTSDPAQASSVTNVQGMLNFTKDMVSGLKSSKDGDNTKYSFSIKPDKMSAFFEKSANGSTSALSAALGGIKFSKMDIVLTAGPDNMVKEVDLDAAMNIKAGSTSTSLSYTMAMVYTSINTGITIQFPDFSQYKEISATPNS